MLLVETAAPAPALRPYIRAYVQRQARLEDKVLVEPVLARLGVMLEFEFAGSYEVRNYGSEKLDATYPISIIGPQTWRRARLIIRGHVESLVVMFQPTGFYSLFGAPTSPFSETGTEGHAVLGRPASRLHERLGNLSTFSARVDLLNDFFLRKMTTQLFSDPVSQALSLLTDAGGPERIGGFARELGRSRRSLERRALACSGVTPKTLSRISRFGRALLLRAGKEQNWAQVAQSAGYYDQMHLIRDFKVFAGGAPASALEEIAPDHLIHFAHSGVASSGM